MLQLPSIESIVNAPQHHRERKTNWGMTHWTWNTHHDTLTHSHKEGGGGAGARRIGEVRFERKLLMVK
jgi:hypothetical protein